MVSRARVRFPGHKLRNERRGEVYTYNLFRRRTNNVGAWSVDKPRAKPTYVGGCMSHPSPGEIGRAGLD